MELGCVERHHADVDVASPSFRRLPGIHAVATYSPGGEGSCQRVLVSNALNATSPRWSYTLIFGNTGRRPSGRRTRSRSRRAGERPRR